MSNESKFNKSEHILVGVERRENIKLKPVV